jgi:hypothetical protein
MRQRRYQENPELAEELEKLIFDALKENSI